MDWRLKIALISLIPLVVSVILHFLLKKSEIKYWPKQILIGVIFGAIAVIGTEFGVPIPGATINARDAAPLCAALIFGAPAGVIAGLIGGIERWFSVYWGVGAYTRVACSVSTILTGLFGAILKRRMFDDRIPSWRHTILIGAVAEVSHMMMVIITNLNDLQNAFRVVKACSIPMITANSLSVTIAVLAINILDKDSNFDKQGKITLSQQFLRRLLGVVMLASVVTSLFTYNLQNNISKSDTFELLSLNISDIEDDINARSDENLLKICRRVRADIEEGERDGDSLRKLLTKYSIAEINIVNKIGIITSSTYDKFVDYDMNSGEQSKEFMCLVNDKMEFAQSYQPTSSDPNLYRKYAGVRLSDGGYVQVGYDAKEFQEAIFEEVANIAKYKHVGQNGGIMILDSNKFIVSDNQGLTGKLISNINSNLNNRFGEEYKISTFTLDDDDYYFIYTKAEGYTVISFIPVAEVDFSRDISNYLNIFLQTLVFATIFILTYFMTKKLVVNNVKSIDNSLQDITNGKLDTVVDIRTNQEFDSLSTGINTTVDAMKNLIDEASKRIDDELAYAKEIQTSSLPSVFPPFADRKEFDIYALMDPAKEVGGDFYDFYLINKHLFAFVVADVAGKGIPAALFMMRAKTTLKTYALGGVRVADIFTNANFNLCEGNDAGMFVTAWMGILDTATGELKYANAGHNRPLIRRKNGSYEYLKGPAGFVLGGMDGIVYKEQSTTLELGDEIFLYTDGVVEATNSDKKLYGDDRLEVCINKHLGEDSETIVKVIKEDVDKFYEGAPQFDDITMMSLRYVKKYEHVAKKEEIK